MLALLYNFLNIGHVIKVNGHVFSAYFKGTLRGKYIL